MKIQETGREKRMEGEQNLKQQIGLAIFLVIIFLTLYSYTDDSGSFSVTPVGADKKLVPTDEFSTAKR